MPPSVWDCQVDFEKIILVLAIKWSRIGTCSKSVGPPEFVSAFLSPNPHPILLQILSILMTSCALNPFLPTTNLPCKFPYPSILSYLLVSVPTLLRAFKTEKIFSLSIVFVSHEVYIITEQVGRRERDQKHFGVQWLYSKLRERIEFTNDRDRIVS